MASELVRIQRGRLSPNFQAARGYLSIASALATTRPIRAHQAVTNAIEELREVQSSLLASRGEAK